MRARAGALFAGVGNGQPITKRELESLIPELSETTGQELTYADVRSEAVRRGLRVVGKR